MVRPRYRLGTSMVHASMVQLSPYESKTMRLNRVAGMPKRQRNDKKTAFFVSVLLFAHDLVHPNRPCRYFLSFVSMCARKVSLILPNPCTCVCHSHSIVFAAEMCSSYGVMSLKLCRAFDPLTELIRRYSGNATKSNQQTLKKAILSLLTSSMFCTKTPFAFR
jgi:hypothetical protein